MDHPTARRRVSRLLGHVAPIDAEQLSSPNPHLLPLNCSSTLNTMIRRCDNTLLFARQSSASQARFMQQVSTGQSSAVSSCPSDIEDSPYQSSAAYQYSGEPLFSRLSQLGCISPESTGKTDSKQGAAPSPPAPPEFARARTEKLEKAQVSRNEKNAASPCSGMEWSPRIDVAESVRNYVVTVELPGVSIMDLTVEVNDQKLIVMGKRSIQQRGSANCYGNPNLKYHRREIAEGPFQVFWPLPKNVNRDMVSAEFVNGFLKITLPKL